MNQNKQIAIEVLQYTGGKENLISATHCMTRLRLVLKDETLVNDEAIKEIAGVLGVSKSGGQYQVIIGQNVSKVYPEFCEEAGLKTEKAIDENLDTKKEKQSFKKIGSKIMDYLSGSFTPLIPVLIAGALFRTVGMLLGPTMLNLITEENDIYIMCNFMYDAAFYFLPVFLGYSAAKKIGASPVLGLFLGASLVVPSFVSLADTTKSIDIWGVFPAQVASYGQTVLPILIAVFFLYFVEKFFNKYVPEMVSMVFAPFLTMAVMIPILFCLSAPIGTWLGEFFGDLLFMFGNNGGFLAIAIVAALYQFLVMVGMHHVIGMLAITVMLEQGSEFAIRPAAAVANWACFGLALGAFLRIKNKKEKALALGYYATGIIGGVSEPIMFGIGIKYKRPFIAMAIGGFVGGIYAALTHVGCYTFASPGFLSVLAFANGGTTNLINGTVACVLAMLVSAIATYILGGFEEGEKSFFKKKKA